LSVATKLQYASGQYDDFARVPHRISSGQRLKVACPAALPLEIQLQGTAFFWTQRPEAKNRLWGSLMVAYGGFARRADHVDAKFCRDLARKSAAGPDRCPEDLKRQPPLPISMM
jgi:hypothetical protein